MLKAGETSLVKGKVASESLWVAASGKQFAKGRADFVNSRSRAIIPLITRLRISYEKSYARASPLDKIISGMLDPAMFEDTAKIVNEDIKDKVSVNLIITTAPAAMPPLIAAPKKIAKKLHFSKRKKILNVVVYVTGLARRLAFSIP